MRGKDGNFSSVVENRLTSVTGRLPRESISPREGNGVVS